MNPLDKKRKEYHLLNYPDSPRHYWIKWTILVKKIFKKSKINFVQYDSNWTKNNFWDLEKLKTIILKHFQANLSQNPILKKKFPKFPKWPSKSKKNSFFEQKNSKKFEFFRLSYMGEDLFRIFVRSSQKKFEKTMEIDKFSDVFTFYFGHSYYPNFLLF